MWKVSSPSIQKSLIGLDQSGREVCNKDETEKMLATHYTIVSRQDFLKQKGESEQEALDFGKLYVSYNLLFTIKKLDAATYKRCWQHYSRLVPSPRYIKAMKHV